MKMEEKCIIRGRNHNIIPLKIHINIIKETDFTIIHSSFPLHVSVISVIHFTFMSLKHVIMEESLQHGFIPTPCFQVIPSSFFLYTNLYPIKQSLACQFLPKIFYFPISFEFLPNILSCLLLLLLQWSEPVIIPLIGKHKPFLALTPTRFCPFSIITSTPPYKLSME